MIEIFNSLEEIQKYYDKDVDTIAGLVVKELGRI